MKNQLDKAWAEFVRENKVGYRDSDYCFKAGDLVRNGTQVYNDRITE